MASESRCTATREGGRVHRAEKGRKLKREQKREITSTGDGGGRAGGGEGEKSARRDGWAGRWANGRTMHRKCVGSGLSLEVDH
jgi:hypothetical protein